MFKIKRELSILFKNRIKEEFMLDEEPQDIVFSTGQNGKIQTVIKLSSKQYKRYTKIQSKYDLNKRVVLTEQLIRDVFNLPSSLNISVKKNKYGDMSIEIT